jgi:hypothetical protein
VYAALDRQQNATRERAIVARLSSFLDARAFAAQFGTEEARNYMLEGMKKPAFVDGNACADLPRGCPTGVCRMSAFGTKPTLPRLELISAFEGRADMTLTGCHFG